MGSFDYWPRPDSPYADADARFEMLREQFQARLCQDRLELRRLGGELTRDGADAAALFEEIQRVAHRIAGAAALFEDREVLGAAGQLETAARKAHRKRSPIDDEYVWCALQTLMVVIA